MEKLIKLIERLFDETKDLILKTITGVIIFIPLDVVLGLLFSKIQDLSNVSDHLSKAPDFEKITPLFFTKKLFDLFNLLSKDTSLYFSILVFYILLFALGKVVYILRQILILDKIKYDYTEWLSSDELNDKNIKSYKKLRELVQEKLKKEDFPPDMGSFLKQNGQLNEYVKDNDYLLYLILGRIYYSSDLKKRALDADEIAFIGSNFFTITFVMAISYYLTFITNSNISTSAMSIIIIFLYLLSFIILDCLISIFQKFLNLDIRKIVLLGKGYLFSIISGFLIFFFLGDKLGALNFAILMIIVFLTTLRWLFIQAVAKRYIARNQRIYLRYLSDKSGAAYKMDLLNSEANKNQ